MASKKKHKGRQEKAQINKESQQKAQGLQRKGTRTTRDKAQWKARRIGTRAVKKRHKGSQ